MAKDKSKTALAGKDKVVIYPGGRTNKIKKQPAPVKEKPKE